LTEKKGNTRVTGKEQYYTPPGLAQELVKKLMNLVQLDNAIWIEPAGGTGNFINAAKNFNLKIWSCDIEPKHPDVIQADYLQVSLELPQNQPVVVFGNPPFGRNNSLSVKFFNRSAEYCDYIAFIVPKSWRKWSVHKKLNNQFHLIADWDLDLDFVDEKNTHFNGGNLKTCFQVWKKQDQLRQPIEVENRNYIIKSNPEEANISMTVYGHGCGKVKTEFLRQANSTQLFLKANPQVVTALQTIDWSVFYANTAYIPALSFLEIMFGLNKHFDKSNVIKK
jgi:predicted RNA methylase